MPAHRSILPAADAHPPSFGGLGTLVSWIVARGAGGLLFGVTERDPGTFAGMIAILTVVAVAAGYLPARRASRIDPMAALRAE